MKKYEIMYIINPTILEEGREAVVEKVTGILTAAGATVAKSEKWGERKLAYPIDKKKTGFYVLATLILMELNYQQLKESLTLLKK